MRSDNLRLAVLGIVSASGLFVTEASADGLSCNSQIVSSGDSTYQVRSACGEPDATNRRTELRTVRQAVAVPCASGQNRCWAVVERAIEVTIDEWTYDFGRHRFVQFLTFEQSKLVRVESAGYGRKLASFPDERR